MLAGLPLYVTKYPDLPLVIETLAAKGLNLKIMECIGVTKTLLHYCIIALLTDSLTSTTCDLSFKNNWTTLIFFKKILFIRITRLKKAEKIRIIQESCSGSNAS